jgi:hypothetical protein
VSSRLRAAAAATGMLLALAVAAVMSAGASAADRPPSYADSVDQALQILRDTRGDDRAAAARAADVLEAGTGQSQREILVQLRRDPPDVADARARLSALSRAVRSPAFAPEPARARQAIRDILAQPRYAGLDRGESPLDRLRDAGLRLLIWVLDRLGDVVSGGFGLVLAAAAAVGLALAALVVVRSARWRGRRDVRAGAAAGPDGRPLPEDRFAAADRMAAAGDYDGAVRALAGAVAAALADERAWLVSPLTVRELFARAPDPAALRPLLAAFEASVYGDRRADEAAYRRAAGSAAFYRPARGAAA